MPIHEVRRDVTGGSVAVALALLSLAAMLGGCLGSNIPDPLPALFRIDAIRYWWEDDYLIVNVTFTNQHPTHTPGQGALDPAIHILVAQEEVLDKDGSVGQETKPAYGTEGHRSIGLDFGTEYGRPWQKRWYNSTTTGPMLIPPGTTMSVEFGLKPDFDYHTTEDGYYYLLVDMPYWYPRTFYTHEFQNEEVAKYYTGCFNRVVPEFYGAAKGEPDCGIWDCTGEFTYSAYSYYKSMGKPDPKSMPACTATNAAGPEYP